MSSSSNNNSRTSIVYKPIKGGDLQQKLKEPREYPLWKTNIMIVLMANNMSELFARLISSSSSTSTLSPEEKTGQAIIYEFIWRHIDKSLHANLGAHIANNIGELKALWDLILDRFESKSTTNLYIVQEEFNNIKWDPIKQSVDDYEAMIVNICNQLKNLEGSEVSDGRKILALVKGLPDSYETVSNNIITTQTKFSDAVTLLRTMEKTKQVKKEKEKMIEQQHDAVNYVKQQFKKKFNSSSSNTIKRWCHVCDRDNHNTKDCDYVKAMKNRRQQRMNQEDADDPKTSESKSVSSLRDSQSSSTVPQCYNCQGMGHMASQCPSPPKKKVDGKKYKRRNEKTLHTQDPTATADSSNDVNESEHDDDSESEANGFESNMTIISKSKGKKKENPMEFRFDTGANTHCTYNKSLLQNIIVLKEPIQITTQGKDPIQVTMMGEIRLKFNNDELVLKDVRYHPEFSENLFSWSQFHKHNDLDLRNITMYYDDDGHWCYSRKDNNKVFIKMKLKRGLYSIIDGSMNALCVDHALIMKASLRSSKKLGPQPDPPSTSIPPVEPQPVQEQVKQQSNGPVTVSKIHQLFGHMCNKHILKIINNTAMSGVEELKSIKLNEADESLCDACATGKATRRVFKKISTHDRASKPCERLYSDLKGPIEIVEKDEACGMFRGRYSSTIIDEDSRKIDLRMIMKKDHAVNHVKDYIPKAERITGNKVKWFHSDGGGEYINNELSEYFSKQGIKYETTCSYTPQNNGVAERANRTIWETALTLLAAANLEKKKFIGEALHHAVYLWNCTVRNGETKSRTELWSRVKPSFKKLHPFGCDAYVTIPKELRKAVDTKIYKCIYLGVDDDHIGGYRLLDVENKKLVISRDVKFNDYSFTFGRLAEGGASEIEKKAVELLEQRSLMRFNEIMLHGGGAENKEEASGTQRRSKRTKLQTQRFGQTSPGDYYHEDIGQASLAYDECVFTAMNMLSNQELAKEPVTFQEAIESEDSVEWKNAVQSELDSLTKNGVWELTVLPKGANCIKTKWVFKKKPDLQGNVARYKARLVAKGFTQVYGLDYKETYAPVGKVKSLLMLLSLANQYGYELNHLDVETAFLNASVNEDIYMELPEGYIMDKKKEQQLRTKHPNERIVLKLAKSLYGIKQAPHNWNELLNSTLTEALNFTRLQSDSCMYVKKSKTNQLMFIFVWVDDMLCSYSKDDEKEWNTLKNQLMNYYKIKDMGDLQMILGMRVVRDREQETIRVDQGLYIDKIFKKFNMQNCQTVSTPEANIHLSELSKDEMSDEQKEYMKKVPYREAIGALLYAAICTRPDIAHAVNQVSQYQINPTPAHWTAVKRIIRYLKSCPNLGLEFKNTSNNSKFRLYLHCHCDANWAQDQNDRKSVGGFLVRLNGDVVSWQVKKQSTVALSSTEAEYMQMTQAAKEIKWFLNLFTELFQISQSQNYVPQSTLYCDNQSAIELSKNDLYHDRTKHIDLRYHFIRDCIQKKLFSLQYISTTEQQADIFTKGLQRGLFIKFRNMIMMKE